MASDHSSKDGLEQLIHQHLRSYFEAHTHDLPPSGLYDRILHHVERPLIAETLRATEGNQLKAAKLLGLNRNTLRKKIDQLNLNEATNSHRRRPAHRIRRSS